MIKPLTSLRFFFALMVFFSHVSTKDDTLFYMTLQKKIFHEGLLGVSFFFILSGFILSLNYTDKIIENKIAPKQFWIARFARIYPLHLLTLLIAIPLSLKRLLFSPLLWALNLILNFFLLQSFIPDRDVYFSFNSPSWSISDEMFFYLMFPFIISMLFKTPKFIYIALVLIILIPLGIHISSDNIQHELFYANPLFRIVDFILGILLFKLYKLEKIKRIFSSIYVGTLMEITAIGLFILFFSFNQYIPQGYRYSCYYWLPMTGIILTFSYQSGYISKILSNKIMVLLGEISFSFYMLHQLVYRYLEAINKMYPIFNNFYVFLAIIFSISLLASYLSYKYIELPANRFVKARFSKLKAA